jgi:hypothetical protein
VNSTADPLAAIRAELVTAARNRIARRRRRRRAAAIAATVALLLAAAATASELTGFSTGVPAVDRLLDVESGDDGHGLELRPGTGGASEALPAPGLTGGKGGVALAYVNRAGDVCAVAAEDIGERGVRGGFGGCYDPADLARRLDRRGLVVGPMALGADERTYAGHADGDVVALTLLLPDARVRARLTPRWTPKGGEAQRFWVAADRRKLDVGDDGVQPEELNTVSLIPRAAELRYADGRVVRVKPGP